MIQYCLFHELIINLDIKWKTSLVDDFFCCLYKSSWTMTSKVIWNQCEYFTSQHRMSGALFTLFQFLHACFHWGNVSWFYSSACLLLGTLFSLYKHLRSWKHLVLEHICITISEWERARGEEGRGRRAGEWLIPPIPYPSTAFLATHQHISHIF